LEANKPTHKLLLQKITKAFDKKDIILATPERCVDQLEIKMKLEAVRPKKRKKVKLDQIPSLST